MPKKFFVSELFPDQQYNAAVGRKDIETSLAAWSFTKIDFAEGRNGFGSKLKVYKSLFSAVNKIRSGDIVFFHLPLYSRVKQIFLHLIRRKGAVCIAYVNDLEGLRDQNPTLLQNELQILSKFYGAVVLNEKMTGFVSERCPHLKLSELIIWDYLLKEIPHSNRVKSREVAFVGNQQKAGFIKYLNQIPEITFHIYGSANFPNYPGNCVVHGEIDSKELVAICKGSFGLVWDGPSIESCEGGAGQYMRINSPYKLSFYLMAGLPIIIWKEAALAEWVVKNKLGIAIDCLQSIPTSIDAISEQAYNQMQQSIKVVQPAIAEGRFLKDALEKLIGPV